MNPTSKPATDDRFRVVRGGSRYNPTAIYVRAASRFSYEPTDRYYNFGFRCAQRGARQPLKGTP